MNDKHRNRIKTSRSLVGTVISHKMDKTVTVLIERYVRHAKYDKYIKRSKKYHAHDEMNAYHEGDLVEIQETRPLAKTKAWTVSRLVQAGLERT